jgi:hypothetical protein
MLLMAASIIQSLSPVRRVRERMRKIQSPPGRGRQLKPRRCAGCLEVGSSRWFWLHTAGGTRCRTTGVRLQLT